MAISSLERRDAGAPTQSLTHDEPACADPDGDRAGAVGQRGQTADPANHGWLPAISLASAVGLLLVAVADAAARDGAFWAETAFWAGLVTLYLPPAWRLFSAQATRRERVGLVALLALSLYAVKLLQNPVEFTFYDELQHWRTAHDIISSGHLFAPNPLLPVSPRFPGLEIATSAVESLTSLSIFQAGVLVIGAGRLALALALFLLFERLCGATRLGGIAALLYMANTNFLFFDAQYGYESLALAYAALALYAVLRRGDSNPSVSAGWTVVAAVAIGAVVVTHHLTSYALVALLILWTIIQAVLRRRIPREHWLPGPGSLALLALVSSAAWLAFVAPITVQYLTPEIGPAVAQFISFLRGLGGGRHLFRDFAGQRPPLWEQLLAYASVLIILLGLPVGWWQIWRRYRASAPALTLAACTLAYPATLALRVTQRGLEVANRTSEFLFLPLALALAVGLGWLLTERHGPWLAPVLAALATITFLGGVILGWPVWARLPGPYLVSADMRSIEPEGVAAAVWARQYLGPNNRVAADLMNRLLMGSLGGQDVVLNGDHVPLVFFAPTFGAPQRAILKQWRVRYLVVDQRLSAGLPMVGLYIQDGEPDMLRHTRPFPAAALAKFDGARGLERIFDSGNIALYAVTSTGGGSGGAP